MTTQKFTIINIIVSCVLAIFVMFAAVMSLFGGHSFGTVINAYVFVVYVLNGVFSYLFGHIILSYASKEVVFTEKDKKKIFFKSNIIISLIVPYLLLFYILLGFFQNNKVVVPLVITAIVVELVLNYVLLSRKVHSNLK